jgi:enoyl-CoA hydratase
MALTGARLDGAECLWAGLATHYLASDRLPEAKARIVEEPQAIVAILDELSAPPPGARIAGNAEKIDRLFAADTLEAIIAALEREPSEWAAKELAAVASKCPATSKVALRELAEGARRVDFAGEMRAEYRIAARMMLRPDFAEGVRAVLIDKDNAPAWNPATPEGVSDEMLDTIFAPLAVGEEWTPFPA